MVAFNKEKELGGSLANTHLGCVLQDDMKRNLITIEQLAMMMAILYNTYETAQKDPAGQFVANVLAPLFEEES